MPRELKFKTSTRLAIVISAAFPLSSFAATAGKIDFAVGPVIALSSDGRSRALTKGSDINSGETINTGKGRAQLRYSDGSQVSLQPGTEYRIDDYRFNGKIDGEEKAFFNLIKGTFRTISGLIGKANKDAYKVTTPVATIGIRGTEFVITSNENGVTVSTGEGLVQVCAAGGCIVLASGESAVVIDKNGSPVRVINKGTESTNEKPGAPSVNIEKPGEPVVVATGVPGWAFAGSSVNASDGQLGNSVFAFGTATLNSNALTKYVPSGEILTGTILGASNTDGTIYWGSWASATVGAQSNINEVNVHYVAGLATTSAQLASLTGQYTFSFLGATAPSIYSSSGVTTQGTAPTGGYIDLDFSSTNISRISLSGFSAVGFNNMVGNNLTRNGATFSGSATVSDFSVLTATASVRGILVGANAERAGLSYSFTAPIGSANPNAQVTGAAVFRNAGPGCISCAQ